MTPSDVQVRLCSVAAPHHSDRLAGQIRTLGYSVEVSGLDQLEVPVTDRKSPLVIHVEPGQDALERAADALERMPGRPSLGVFPHPADTRMERLLEQCVDFLFWPCSTQELGMRIGRACGPARTAIKVSALDPEAMNRLSELNLIGRSPAFLRTAALMQRYVDCDAPVLIGGETGTGKELTARALHYLGQRRHRPFIPINCGALPDHLFENELFGHERGAYTDARHTQRGLIAQAEGGSLFLDEVDSLSDKAQVTLLRFLQDLSYRPLGGEKLLQADTRLIAASNRPLRDLVTAGRFREDLLFRLDVLALELPALRERGGDVEFLAEHFLQRLSARHGGPVRSFSPRLWSWMRAHHWPGNIRELESVVHRSFLLSEGPTLELPAHEASPSPPQPEPGPEPAGDESFHAAKQRAVDRFECDFLERLMRTHGGNVSQAARHTGKERRALGKLLSKHGIDPIRYRCSSSVR